MNKIFSLVRNSRTGQWTVASELARGYITCGCVIATLSTLAAPAWSTEYINTPVRAADIVVTLNPGDSVSYVRPTSNGMQAGAIEASGSGGKILVSGASITADGDSVSAAYAHDNGRIQIMDGSLTGRGHYGYALYATKGGVIDTVSSTLNGIGANGSAVYVAAGASISTIDSHLTSQQTSAITVNGAGRADLTGGSVKGAAGMVAMNNGSLITAKDVAVDVSGNGLLAQPGQTKITFAGGSVKSGSTGVYANGAGSVVDLSDGSRTSIVAGSRGVWALSGGTVTLNGDSVVSVGTGMNAMNLGSHIHATNTSIVTTGNNAVGALASTLNNAGGALVEIDSGDVTSIGVRSHGVAAIGAGNRVDLSSPGSTLITTQGADAYGAYANLGEVDLNRDSITTHGNGAMGAVATGTLALLDGLATSVMTRGDEAAGVMATNDGHATLREAIVATTGSSSHGTYSEKSGLIVAAQTQVSTVGEGSFGVYANDSGAIHLEGSTVSATGAGAHGAALRSGGALKAADTTIHATGQSASAVFAGPGDADRVNILDLNGGHLVADGASAIRAESAQLDVHLDGTTVGSSSGVALEALSDPSGSGSRITMDATGGSLLIGDVMAQSGSSIDLALHNGSSLAGATHRAGDIRIDSTSIWQITGDSDLRSLTLDGTAAVQAPEQGHFKTVTVSGDYVGNNGTMILNTVLGDDNSATDKLVVAGNTAGLTNMKVNAVADTGEYTRADGIEVVHVSGASKGQFVLDGRAVAGAREYLLVQGGKANPDDGHWYLRSEAPAALPCEQSSTCSPTDNPAIDPANDAPLAPVYRPEPGAYLGNQAAAMALFQHTLHDRLGEVDYDERQRASGSKRGAVWSRVVGQQHDGHTGMGQVALDTHSSLLQLGSEFGSWTAGDSRWQAGAMAGLGRADTHVGSRVTGYQAKGHVRAQTVGMYGTWYANASKPTGLYLDSWLQYGRFDNAVQGQLLVQERYDATAWSASLEAGYSMEIGRGTYSAFYLEPQAQILVGDYHADSHVERNGTGVRTVHGSSITTRVGARGYTRPLNDGHNRVQPFVEINWLHRGDGPAVAMNDEQQILTRASNVYQLKGGAQLELGNGWTGWGHLGVQKGHEEHDVQAQMGVKYSW